MRPPASGDNDEPLDASDLPSGDAPDLAQAQARFERLLDAHHLHGTARDALRGEIGRYAPDTLRAALPGLHERMSRESGRIPARGGFASRHVSHSGAGAFRRVAGMGVLAAVMLAAAVGGVALWRHGAPPLSALTEGRQYRTPLGRRATVRLPDGSTVMLAPGSVLRTGGRFGMDDRDLHLEGEAYFDVVHAGVAPFRVHTAHGVTEDIGTRFTVRAYPEDAASRVVVAEGSVAVGRGVILRAGEVAHVTAHAPPVVRHPVSVRALLAWTTGQLEFVNTPLHEAAAVIARWYGVTVRVDDPVLAQRTITAAFHDVPASAVLAGIARMVGARVEEDGAVRRLVPAAPDAGPAGF